ncbi:MAG: hypothetical protein OEN50_18260 [Deltaproteobacteria bacterium]|nr:hypothetical protein [Deltaproteobacteria bacterium]
MYRYKNERDHLTKEVQYWKEECNTQLQYNYGQKAAQLGSQIWDSGVTGSVADMTPWLARNTPQGEDSIVWKKQLDPGEDMDCRFDASANGPHPADQLDWKGVQTVWAKFERALDQRLNTRECASSFTECMKLVTVHEFRQAVKALENTTGFTFTGVTDEVHID